MQIHILKKGKIIVIEGLDKAGKRTQCMLLMNSLKLSGKVCALLNFPDYTTSIGSEIRSFLDGRRDYPNELKHMLLSANRWEKRKEIQSMQDNGTMLIMNRYYQSNLVYGISNGLNLNWLLNLDRGMPKEDLVIVLDVDPHVIKERATQNHDLFEKDQRLLPEVYKNYHKLAKRFRWKLINGERNKDQVHQEILKVVHGMKLY